MSFIVRGGEHNAPEFHCATADEAVDHVLTHRHPVGYAHLADFFKQQLAKGIGVTIFRGLAPYTYIVPEVDHE